MTNHLKIPDIEELELFFGVEANESPEEGFISFEVQDGTGLHLIFSIRIFEESVETLLVRAGKEIMAVGHELGDRLIVEERTLWCHFVGQNDKTTLQVSLDDGIQVRWSTLRTR